jgi:hypothetical protein
VYRLKLRPQKHAWNLGSSLVLSRFLFKGKHALEKGGVLKLRYRNSGKADSESVDRDIGNDNISYVTPSLFLPLNHIKETPLCAKHEEEMLGQSSLRVGSPLLPALWRSEWNSDSGCHRCVTIALPRYGSCVQLWSENIKWRIVHKC